MEKNQRSNKLFIILEVIFYALLPYVIWNYGREPLGDYIAMLISTIPGIAYMIYRFILERQFNITGLFILGSLALGTTLNLLSGSAEQMIWNGIYLNLFYTLLYIITLIIKRPLSLYYAVDFLYLQGYARTDSRALFFQKGIFKWFQFIQAIFIMRGFIMTGLTVYLLKKYGVDGYGSMLVYKLIVGWAFSILTIGMYFYINVPVRNFHSKQQRPLHENDNLPLQQSNATVD
ncbi:VC0807 family protein [Lysinibacillus sp. NPDC097195]|uniref:VC0807 family protein n=1 Tax=Lysinibacillus sp. NPDC097195 TaxID=3364141 RepID=UPI0037FD96D5